VFTGAAKGESAWPPLALFKALLLAAWYDLSDVKLAEALADRASFRRFCGFCATEPTPERTAFVRFRAELVRRGLDRSLFETVTRQLTSKGVAVRTGTLVDATLIPSASIRHDDEARWAGHRRRKPVHGYKAHVATDQAAILIEAVEVTTANVHDAARLQEILPADPGEVFADSAFAGRKPETSSLPMAARRARCKLASGVVRRPLSGWRLTTPRSVACGRASRKCLARPNAAMACAACAGTDWPKPACKCALPRSPTTCAVALGCYLPPRHEPRPGVCPTRAA
jgi:IS5 family transposase